MTLEQRAAHAQRTNRTGPIAGVVLAAGTSSRMGHNKLLLDVAGQTLVRRTVATALAAGLDPILVVLGHEPDAVRTALASLRCRFVVNPRYAEGMNSSVRTGIAALGPEVAAAIVLLADMPFVASEMIATLVARYRNGDALLIVSDYEGVVAPPTLVDRSLFAELAGEAGRGCGKRLRRRHPDQTESVSWPASALADLDVPDDYARVKARLAAT